MDFQDVEYMQSLYEEDTQDRLWPISPDIMDIFNHIDETARLNAVDEATYNDIVDREVLKVEVMDIDKFIKQNKCQPITNPTFFATSGAPTSDGLLSNEIFGLTKTDRAGIFAYIDLVEDFIDPSCYKALLRIDKKFNAIVHSTQRFIINDEGELIEDEENGNTGIKWLKNNFDKLYFTRTKSRKRDANIQYLLLNYKKGRMFINKYLVIPPYYRDVNNTGKNVGVGQINKLYVNLIVGAKSLRENNDYGFSMADSTIARMQDTLKAIYDWFCGNDNKTITDKGTGMSGKFGILKRANLAKTSDYSSRLVLSAPELKVESVDDMMVTLDKSALPLAAVLADFYPFIMFHLRRFFENEFLNVTQYPIYVDGKIMMAPLKREPMSYFDDDTLKAEIKKYLYSYDTRFQPIEAPIDYDAINLDRKKKIAYMVFRGTPKNEDYGENPEAITRRRLTWVDAFYVSAVKATEGKTISFTRYPIDKYSNTIYTGIEVASTIKTEPLYINGDFYQFYPQIRDDEILQSTEDKFVDTMRFSNLYLKGLGGDYDGDTGNVKGSFFNETNEELKTFMNSKVNYIGMNCGGIREYSNESVQAIYNLTKVLYEDKDKLTDPVF